MDVTKNEKRILVLAMNNRSISVDGAMLVFRNKQYASDILKRLAQLDYLALMEFGTYTITAKGKSALGIEENVSLTKYQGE